MEETFYVYILECADKSYYVGSTNDVDERVELHNHGIAADWTKNCRPAEVVYQEEHHTLVDARRREEQINGWTKVKKEKPIKGIWKKR